MSSVRKRILQRWLFRAIGRLYLGKPEQAEFLATRYITWKSIRNEGLNQLFYMLHFKRSFAVTSLQLEVTNRCNMKCPMCPVNREMKRKRGDMDFDKFRKLVDENPEIEYYLLMNWGEPLLHPRFFDMVRYVRLRGGRPLFTTNGALLTDKTMREMIGSGVDRVTISMDGIGDTYEHIRGRPYAEIEEKINRLIEMRDELKSPMAVDLNLVVFDETENDVAGFMDQWKGKADRVQIQPRISFSGKRKTRCKEPWRGNVIVLWDGTVVPCCVDYDGAMPLGNAFEKPLREIMNGGPARRLRSLHNRGLFIGPCETCSEYETPWMHSRFG